MYSFSVGNRLIEAKLQPTHERGLVMDILAIFKTLKVRMHTAGELVFKQNQELRGRILIFKILCGTINRSKCMGRAFSKSV